MCSNMAKAMQSPWPKCYRRYQQLQGATLLCARRSICTSPPVYAAAVTAEVSKNINLESLDPNLVHTRGTERQLLQRKKVTPIGSRRRRALAAENAENSIPFEQLPYQCFQEARKVLAADREEKLLQIAEMRKRIAKAQSVPAEQLGGEYAKKGKVVRMQKYLEDLKILADINDPMVKKRFEDGLGDMDRPIYRYLADKKWREYKRPQLMQRISQFHIVPDIIDHLDPITQVSFAFGRRNIQPGEFVESLISESPPRLHIQPFDKGERLISIALVDPDIPDLENDNFRSRCHFLAVNIPVSPTSTSVILSQLDNTTQIVQPWLAPFAQKGSPYHRLVFFVVQQREGQAALDPATLKDNLKRSDGWNLRSFTDATRSTPVGASLFRTIWDDNADKVGLKAGHPEAKVELVRKKPEKLPYKKKDGARFR